jgi:hypothetical protein
MTAIHAVSPNIVRADTPDHHIGAAPRFALPTVPIYEYEP